VVLGVRDFAEHLVVSFTKSGSDPVQGEESPSRKGRESSLAIRFGEECKTAIKCDERCGK